MSFSQSELIFDGLTISTLAFLSIDNIACQESGIQFKPIELRIMTYAKNDISYLLATVHKIDMCQLSMVSAWVQKIIPMA